MKKKAIISLVLISLMAFGIGAGSFAWFTSQATSTDNVFTAGTLEIEGPGTITSEMLNVSNIYPSWQESKAVKIKNIGSLDFKCRMSVKPLTGNKLYDGPTPLQVSVNGGAYKDIDELGYVGLGQLGAGKEGSCTIVFRLPEAADNEYQGASATFEFVFDATQTENPGWTEEYVPAP